MGRGRREETCCALLICVHSWCRAVPDVKPKDVRLLQIFFFGGGAHLDVFSGDHIGLVCREAQPFMVTSVRHRLLGLLHCGDRMRDMLLSNISTQLLHCLFQYCDEVLGLQHCARRFHPFPLPPLPSHVQLLL